MNISFDIARGVDVFKGNKLLWHFVGPYAYLMACDYAAEHKGAYIRYWGKKS